MGVFPAHAPFPFSGPGGMSGDYLRHKKEIEPPPPLPWTVRHPHLTGWMVGGFTTSIIASVAWLFS
jgi:hypothetical protein